ncbi:phospholipase D delta-like [Olea europaea var. sylvestris]|uniref:phospholipase D delta-like n=1 Tax=Olea europaea var. sylvestris TaxID=158386 RepID=UPI000C1D421A|nr:phospholipase D delta-like [Olea europaea var. sylvestris]
MAEDSSEQVMYLHGDLDLHIIEARSLPNMDLVSESLRRFFTACDACRTTDTKDGGGSSHHERKLHHRRKIITSDPYVTVLVPQATLARTRVLPNSQNPRWNERFYIPLAHPVEFLEFRVKDNDMIGADTIGKVTIPAEKIASGEIISGWFPLIASSRKPPKPDSALRLEMKFTPCDKSPLYNHGIAGDPACRGVRNTYFPLRKGCAVTLYQDAHISDEVKMPDIKLDDGCVREHAKCWEDLCYAISEAHHLIYVVGWSVFHKIKLVREPTRPLPRGGDLTLGELLKYKSQEGVRVLLLIWDDKTSHNKFLIDTVWIGMMLLVILTSFMFFSSFEDRWILLDFMVNIDSFVTNYISCLVLKSISSRSFSLPQIFRSIDSGSVRGFPKYYDVAHSQNLVYSKNLVIDKSIQVAYIQAIRSAQHFIYIENQYFLGSSYAWPAYKDAGADHLIPMELALKIASKIRAKERFAVYVVIPMWPEGNPKDNVMQEILFWQGQTMQMMYQVVAQELKSMQIVDSHPLDYLNFYCLGNREEIPDTIAQSSGDADKVSASLKFKRFMIYVHAKGMLVDDEYVIVGSANINQRSMAGTKDTEIAMGAYQPHHTWAKKQQPPHGQVYGYRMSLWAEHLGMVEKCFEEPETMECVKRVNEVAEDNWKRYTAEEFTTLEGHLLKYPIEVDGSGNVSPLPGHENFPDVGGRVLGAQCHAIPDVLTT